MIIVVKIGGRALLSNMDRLLEDLAETVKKNIKVILVHGGGDLVTEYSKKMNIEPKIMLHPSGMKSRYTSAEELNVYTMVMAGLINKTIISKLLNKGVKALGITGVDLGVIKAERKKRIVILNGKGRKQIIPGGFTGKITDVSSNTLEELLEITNAIVMAPLALGTEGELLNIDGDQAASRIAVAVKAVKLILLTDVPGVIVNDKVIDLLDQIGANRLSKQIGAGMNRKLLMASDAVKGGVEEAIISDGRLIRPISSALQGSGTHVFPVVE